MYESLPTYLTSRIYSITQSYGKIAPKTKEAMHAYISAYACVFGRFYVSILKKNRGKIGPVETI